MVRLESKVNRYIGSSTDKKPEPGDFVINDDNQKIEVKPNDVPVGSTFFAIDTAEIHRWDGKEWVYSPSAEVRAMNRIEGLLQELLEAQKAIF